MYNKTKSMIDEEIRSWNLYLDTLKVKDDGFTDKQIENVKTLMEVFAQNAPILIDPYKENNCIVLDVPSENPNVLFDRYIIDRTGEYTFNPIYINPRA